MTINQAQDEIIEEFLPLEDWMDRYQLIIDLGEGASELSDDDKKPEYLIDGCQSRVWVKPHYQEGLLHFDTASDAVIVKGLVSLLMRVYNDRSPQEILESEPYFIDEIGLKEHLSPTRSNGLTSMLKKIKLYALAAAEGKWNE